MEHLAEKRIGIGMERKKMGKNQANHHSCVFKVSVRATYICYKYNIRPGFRSVLKTVDKQAQQDWEQAEDEHWGKEQIVLTEPL